MLVFRGAAEPLHLLTRVLSKYSYFHGRNASGKLVQTSHFLATATVLINAPGRDQLTATGRISERNNLGDRDRSHFLAAAL